MLKKLLYGCALMAFVSSCDENFDDWAAPQGFEPEESQLIQINVTPAEDVDIATAKDTIDLFSFGTDAPDSYSVDSIEVYVEDSTGVKYPVTPTKESFKARKVGVLKAELIDVVEKIYGKRPTPRELTIKSAIYAYTDASKSTLVRSAFSTSKLNVTLVAPKISENYYVVGGTLDWAESAASKAQKFNHSDKDVYDDPVFTITIPAAEGDTWFAIGDDEACDAIAAGDWSKLLGNTTGNGENGTSGMLKPRNEIGNDGSFKVDAGAKFIKIELNMMDGTYKVTAINFENYLFFIGATDGWSGSDQKVALVSDEGLYKGFVYVADPNGWGLDFKFQRVAGSWDNEINSGTFTGGITGDVAADDGNIKVTAGEGVYYMELDMVNNTLKGTKIYKVGLIGDFNEWGGDVEMTWNATDYCY
ncbi:MAG: DUF5115 domain-containing protein, partial [Bacteroidaceae bacterium]|nr:DUF5115 domain-containing protein [Bacteroidaceae bacterium]